MTPPDILAEPPGGLDGRFRQVMDAAPVMIWVSGADKLCIWFNRPWLEFTGRALEQELGTGWAEGVHPDDFDRCLDIYTSHFDVREPFRMQYRLRHYSGHYRWIDDSGIPRTAQDGTFLGYIGSCIDVHESAVRLEKEVASRLRTERRLQEALTTGAVITFDWDVVTDVVRRSNNAAQVLGFEPQQSLSGASFLSRVPPDDLARMKALWSTLNRDNSTCSITYRFLRLDGREIWLRGTMKAEFDADGRLVRLNGLTRDITERKQANMRIAADLNAMRLLHRVGIECARGENELNYCLNEILDVAVAIAGANKGNIQLFDQASGTLTIAAQLGFKESFMRYFACVSDNKSACGAAMQSGERVLVEDVTLSEIFIGKPSLDVLLEVGVRAVISVPLISSSRKILGMLSTHFSLPHRPSERDLQLLDLLARQAADYLERRAADEQQKVLVAELQESEGRMRAIVNTAQNGIITIDDNGTIEGLNPAAERIFGYSPEETVGRNVNMLMPEPFRGEHDIYL